MRVIIIHHWYHVTSRLFYKSILIHQNLFVYRAQMRAFLDVAIAQFQREHRLNNFDMINKIQEDEIEELVNPDELQPMPGKSHMLRVST